MVVSITPAQPGDRAGPGLPITLSSNFVGPITTAAQFVLSVLNPTGPVIMQQIQIPTFGLKTTSAFVLSDEDQTTLPVANQMPTNDQVVTLQGDLTDGGTTVDTGQRTNISWDPVAGIGNQSFLLHKQTQGSGGFTDSDRQTLTQVQQSTVITTLLNSLTLKPLTSGPTGGPVSAQLVLWVFGCIVRLTTIPDEFPPRTPDDDYRQATLAVATVFRGGDPWLRFPVHNSSRFISFWGPGLDVGVASIALSEWLLNLELVVTFKPGVLGEVFLMGEP